MNDVDMTKILETLSKMNPKDLENGIAKANEILKSGNANDVINKLKNQ